MKTLNDLTSNQSKVKNDYNCKSFETIEEQCKQRGIRFTPIRKYILKLIWDSQSAVKAYDLLEEVKPHFIKAKPVTVYRTLDFFLEQGFIHKVMSLNAFIACKHFHEDNKRLLLICTQCQEIEEKTGDEMMKTISNELQESSFINQISAIEVQGLCANCDSH